MRIIGDIKYKAFCYFGEINTKGIFKVLFFESTFASIIHRITQFFQKIKLAPFAQLFLEFYKILFGCNIGRGASFESGLVLPHPRGVLVNGNVVGGKNITIQGGVVIGSKYNGLPVLTPSLGDNIYIGSGAKIIGDVKIGSNVNIGANAVVIKDVPDNVTVAGVPAKVVKRKI